MMLLMGKFTLLAINLSVELGWSGDQPGDFYSSAFIGRGYLPFLLDFARY